MLVLSRKPGQSIVIAGEIVVSVVEIGRGRVQIGVTAPDDVPIHRDEIFRRMQAEQEGSLESASEAACSWNSRVENDQARSTKSETSTNDRRPNDCERISRTFAHLTFVL